MATLADSLRIQKQIQERINMQNRLFKHSGMIETIEKINKFQESLINNINFSALENVDTRIHNFQNSIQFLNDTRYAFQINEDSLGSISQSLNYYNKVFNTESFRSIVQLGEKYQDIIKSFDTTNLYQIYSYVKNIDYSNIEYIDFEHEVDDKQDEIDDYNNLSSDEKFEVDNVIGKSCEAIKNGNWDLNGIWINWFNELKVKHPIKAYLISKTADKIFDKIITAIFMLAIAAFSLTGFVKVKEEPHTSAPTIINLHVDNLTIITGDNIKYYYKVEFSDENGNMIEGYVSKKKITEFNKFYNNMSVEENLIDSVERIR